MANFVIKRGLKADLPVTLTDGTMYFTTDTGEFFIDCYNSLNTLERRSVFADSANKDSGGNVITNTYAPLNSPILTGMPIAPTAQSGTNTTQIATTAFVTTAVSEGGGGDMSQYVTVEQTGTIYDPNPINANTLNLKSSTDFVLKEEVVNALDNTTVNLPLSANQGKILNDSISDINAALSLKAPLDSPALIGTPTKQNSEILAKSDVINDVVSTSIDVPLSANQGKLLNDNIVLKAPLASPVFTGTPKNSSNTNYTTAQLRNIFFSTSTPASTVGSDGDVCIVYTA